MRIAITIREDLNNDDTWYSSGIGQNLKFYYDLFEILGCDVFWLTYKQLHLEYNGKVYQSATRQEAFEGKRHFDIVFEGGVTIIEEEQARIRDKSNCKIIALRCGHQYYVAAEGLFVANSLHLNSFVPGFDEMWLLPHHSDQASWLSVLHKTIAFEVPYIWEPEFIARTFHDVDKLDKPNVVVMEPNISVTKNALLPMVAIQKLYELAPESFHKAYIYGSQEFGGKDYFLHNFVSNMPAFLADTNKVYFEPRKKVTDIFQKPHILLSHQFHCELNNLYKEAIYMGVPLIHNSVALKDVGYYYKGYNVIQAAEKMIEAIAEHSPRDSAERGKAFLYDYSIHNPKIQKHYAQLLDRNS